MAVNTLVWAVTLVSMTYLAKEAGGMLPIVFWQNVCAVLFGLVLYFCVSDYRKGLRMRILNQKRLFLSLSAVNEVFSQMGYVFKYMALAYAPVIAYGNTLSSLESGLVLIAFFLYPIRNESIKIHHVLGVVCIIIGVAFVDFSLPRGLFG
jgi:drug/metabolite transporter (DMT)-like permease